MNTRLTPIKYALAIYARTTPALPYEYCGIGSFEEEPKVGSTVLLGKESYLVDSVDYEKGLELTQQK